MNSERRDRLISDYKMLEVLFYEVQEDWSNGDLTTLEAMEQQRMLREQMQEIRELLVSELDEDA